MRVLKYRVKRMHIYQNKGVWTYRRRVDSGLEEAFKEFTGKKEPFFKRSLGTRDSKEAHKLAIAAEVEYESLMQKLRYQSHLSPSEIRAARLSLRVGGILRSARVKLDLEVVQNLKAQIDAELKRYREKVKAADADSLDELEPVKYGAFFKKQMSLKDYYEHLQNASRILHVYERMFLEPNLDVSAELARTRQFLQQSQLGLGDMFLQELQAYRQSSPREVAGKVINNSAAPLLSEAVQIWKDKNNPSDSSYGEWSYAVKRFIELHGDLRVDAIEDRHIVEYRAAIQKIPVRLPQKYMAMPLGKLLQLSEAGEFEGMQSRSPATVRKAIIGLSTILQVLVDDGTISRNPARKKAPKSEDDGNKRPPYEFDELELLFTSSLYKRDFWHSPARQKPSRFWSPLIALYTGCRAGEIAQLTLNDVREEPVNGKSVWYLRVTTLDDKSVKTKAGMRDIPIHSELLKMGFIEHVKELRSKGEKRLFPDINPHRKKPAGFISSNHTRYVEKIGLKKDGKSFHSFRDNFSDACVNSGMDDRTTDRLLGHAMTGAKKHYGKGLWLSTSKKLIDKLYKGTLDLSHLHIEGKKELRVRAKLKGDRR